MNRQWTSEEAWEWYRARPWITGCNYFPSGTVNDMEFWQEWNHETIFRDVGREVALAASIGFNSLRVFLRFHIWRLSPERLYSYFDELLAICGKHGVTLMPVLFSDCVPPKHKFVTPQPGIQPEPVPGYFGGSRVTSFEPTKEMGWMMSDEPEMKQEMEAYVRGMARRYGKDPRVLIWNVWNEPGNSNRGSTYIKDLENVFAWLREEDVSQPLTSDAWSSVGSDGYHLAPGVATEIERRAVELSDIVSFHYYGDYWHTREFLNLLKGYGRPLINNEWLHRPQHSFIQEILPLFRRENVGSYLFGFVNGKRQFHVVWEGLKGDQTLDTSLWMHDLFYADFSPYDAEEIRVLKEINFGSRK